MCGSKKYPYTPCGNLLEIANRGEGGGGRGGFKTLNALKESMKLNWNFQRGGVGGSEHHVCLINALFLRIT